MSANIQVWMESLFNISYLIVIWGLVSLMILRLGRLKSDAKPFAIRVIAAFGLLAFGDTGHVGFRVWAYSLGGLESSLDLLGRSVSLVGLGALMTAVTITIFYTILLEIWRFRYGRNMRVFEWLLVAAGLLRLLMMTLPINQWGQVIPPQPWSAIRNIPLMIQGLGVAFLILRDARISADSTFWRVGISILVSFAFYLPVILFVQQLPLLGMLMIPKTIAYVAMGWFFYQDIYQGGADFRTFALSRS
jgi:hypothetical protein